MRHVLSATHYRAILAGLLALLAFWLAAVSTASAWGPPEVFDGKAKWDNWSWDTNVKVERGWPIYEGAPSMRVHFLKKDAGLSYGTSEFDTSDYTHLKFMMHHNGGGIPSLQVGLHGKDGKLIKMVPAVLYADADKRGWWSVSIPLNDLGSEGKSITRVSLQQRHYTTDRPFNIAALQFVKDGKAKGKAHNADASNVHTAYIFDDKAQWADYSWDTKAKVNKYAPHPVYDGAASLAVEYTKPWAGLSFAADGFVSGYKTLRFAMREAGGGVPSLQVVLHGKSGEIGKARVAPYIVKPKNGWFEVEIPIADLGAADKEITRVTLQEGKGMKDRIYIDELRFTYP